MKFAMAAPDSIGGGFLSANAARSSNEGTTLARAAWRNLASEGRSILCVLAYSGLAGLASIQPADSASLTSSLVVRLSLIEARFAFPAATKPINETALSG